MDLIRCYDREKKRKARPAACELISKLDSLLDPRRLTQPWLRAARTLHETLAAPPRRSQKCRVTSDRGDRLHPLGGMLSQRRAGMLAVDAESLMMTRRKPPHRRPPRRPIWRRPARRPPGSRPCHCAPPSRPTRGHLRNAGLTPPFTVVSESSASASRARAHRITEAGGLPDEVVLYPRQSDALLRPRPGRRPPRPAGALQALPRAARRPGPLNGELRPRSPGRRRLPARRGLRPAPALRAPVGEEQPPRRRSRPGGGGGPCQCRVRADCMVWIGERPSAAALRRLAGATAGGGAAGGGCVNLLRRRGAAAAPLRPARRRRSGRMTPTCESALLHTGESVNLNSRPSL
jgi:hypothetical protein